MHSTTILKLASLGLAAIATALPVGHITLRGTVPSC